MRSKDEGTVSERFKKAIGSVPFSDTVKIGWQANQRFWELGDIDNQAYSGLS